MAESMWREAFSAACTAVSAAACMAVSAVCAALPAACVAESAACLAEPQAVLTSGRVIAAAASTLAAAAADAALLMASTLDDAAAVTTFIHSPMDKLLLFLRHWGREATAAAAALSTALKPASAKEVDRMEWEALATASPAAANPLLIQCTSADPVAQAITEAANAAAESITEVAEVTAARYAPSSGRPGVVPNGPAGNARAAERDDDSASRAAGCCSGEWRSSCLERGMGAGLP